MKSLEFEIQISLEHDTVAIWTWLEVEVSEQKITCFLKSYVTSLFIIFEKVRAICEFSF